MSTAKNLSTGPLGSFGTVLKVSNLDGEQSHSNPAHTLQKISFCLDSLDAAGMETFHKPRSLSSILIVYVL